jgi:hypothetical protein
MWFENIEPLCRPQLSFPKQLGTSVQHLGMSYNYITYEAY